MQDDIVVVYQADSLAEAKMVSDRLSEENIASFIDNVTSPLDGLTAAEQTIEVRVRHEDTGQAQRIIDEFINEKTFESDNDLDS